MNLNFSPDQVFVTGQLDIYPLVQNWQFTSSNQVGYPTYIFMKNQPQSGYFVYQIKPKDSYSLWVYQGYTNMRIVSEAIYPQGYPNQLLIGCDLFPQINYTNTVASSWHQLSLGISPSLNIASGQHIIVLKFKILGTKNGQESILSTYDFPITIHVFEEGIYHSPLDFTFFKSANVTPTQMLVVGGADWTLNVPKGLMITSNQVTVSPTQEGGFIAFGSGNKTFQLGLSSSIGNVIEYEESTQLNVVVSRVGQNNNIPVTVIQTGDYFPLSLTYQISSGVVNHDHQIITINKLGQITFDHSSFLNVELYEIDDVRKLKVMVADPSIFGPGEFDGEIYLTVGTSTYLIPISIIVSDQFDVGIENNSISFTRSMVDLEFQSSNENTYIKIDFTTNQTAENFTYKIPFINGKCRKNIGRVMDRLINFNSENLNATFDLPLVHLNLNEIQSGQSISSFTKNNIGIMKGYKPIMVDKSAILQHNAMSRFTPKSFALINVLAGTGSYQYKILKNEIEVYQSSIIFGFVNTIKMEFQNYDVVPGDLLEFVLIVGESFLKKSFPIFPEIDKSMELVYIDSFGLKSVVNFTSPSFRIENEFANEFESYLFNSDIHKRKLNKSNEKTIVLNTGFLLEKQSIEIEELMQSKEAWLYVDNNKILKLIPKSNKIISRDTERFLVNYDVEFIINPEVYAQDYSF